MTRANPPSPVRVRVESELICEGKVRLSSRLMRKRPGDENAPKRSLNFPCAANWLAIVGPSVSNALFGLALLDVTTTDSSSSRAEDRPPGNVVDEMYSRPSVTAVRWLVPSLSLCSTVDALRETPGGSMAVGSAHSGCRGVDRGQRGPPYCALSCCEDK